MRHQAIKGAASGAPNLARIAQDFVAIGGRLMVDPSGSYVSTIDMALLFESVWPQPQQPEAFIERRAVAATFTRAEQRYKQTLAEMVRANGSATPNGWLVWRAAA